MFNFFKEKCPICKMELEKGKEYPEALGKRFCSEKCRDAYSEKEAKKMPKKGGGCCS